MGKNPNEKQPSRTVSRGGLTYGKPACTVCGKGTRRLRKPKWSACETGHRLYKMKGR